MRVQSTFQEEFRVLLDHLPDLDVKHTRLLSLAAPMDKYVIPFSKTTFEPASCSPPTPVGDLDQYTANINSLHSRIAQVLNGTPANSLVMGTFAQAVNALANYVNTLPDQFCIGPSNQGAFDRLNAALSNSENTIQRGKSFFEGNLDRFVGQATPLLNNLYNTSSTINSSSRDFTPVSSAAQRYDGYVSQFELDIWTMSARIESLWNQYEQSFNSANAALTRAVSQIETNVEAEAQRFVDQQKSAEDAFRHWDTVDGKQGYERYYNIIREVVQIMIPAFNAFRSKVPGTNRIKNATTRAQQSVEQIDTGFRSFPNFRALPADSSGFPHLRYGTEDRKYGGDAVHSALQTIANAYKSRTDKKLYIGDMQYEHGGKMGIHKSHKNGIDADVDGIEIGDVPNHDAAKALSLAKEILSAGAQLVFYASQATVNDANAWAGQNGISGRLQLETGHTKHFHLRMPV